MSTTRRLPKGKRQKCKGESDDDGEKYETEKKKERPDPSRVEKKNTRDLLADPKKSVREVILEQNRADKALLKLLVAKEISPNEFKAQTSERLKGQWQWGMCSYNIRDSRYLCKHGCRYCYIGPMFARFGRKCAPVSIEDPMPTDETKVANVSPYGRPVASPSDRKMIFFPSSSDTFRENAEDYVAACKKMIDAGHEIMYVTKAPTGAPEAVVAAFEALPDGGVAYKRAVTVYVTITSDDPAILDEFEPNAPKYEARIQALHFYASRGFNANVMMEPYLSDPIPLLQKVLAELPPDGIIALGKMNYAPQMKFFDDPEKNAKVVAHLERLYARDKTMSVHEMVRDDSRIFLKKDSVVAVSKFVR